MTSPADLAQHGPVATAPDPALSDLESWDTVALEELTPLNDLQRRFDDKFLVRLEQLPVLFAALDPAWRVLQVDGSVATPYRSVYFDTPDLRTYRDHLKGRRRRYKIRTRSYGAQPGAMLELKLKGAAGRTEKVRWPHPGPTPEVLDAEALALLDAALREAYGCPVPDGLTPIAETVFERVTLADLDRLERVTIDRALTATANGRTLRFGADHAVVETKAARRSGQARKQLLRLGHRPQRVSKYCVGLVAAHDDLQGNPWIPAVRRLGPVPVG